MLLLLTLCFFLVGLNIIETDHYDKDRTKEEKRWVRDDGTLLLQCFYRENDTLSEARHY